MDELREHLERLGALAPRKPEHPPTGRLDVPIPPARLLERALGYGGEAEWLAIWWEPAGDEARWSDGRRSADAEWPAYLLYTRHPRVAPALWPYDLGSSDGEARHKLLLHRPTRQLYAETVREADRTVYDQWPREREEDLAPEEWAEIREQMNRARLRHVIGCVFGHTLMSEKSSLEGNYSAGVQYSVVVGLRVLDIGSKIRA